ncbi:site-specific recombinase XerD [Bacteroidales bacterium 6E]|nr:site-specific recombinase XerD [Bacteroidales bacterium 6E]
MKVHLRQRKQSKTGQTSLYLEIYKGTVNTPDGKTKILRDYKYLNLYLTDKPTTPLERQQNKDIIKLANDIRAKTELEIKNGQYGFRSGQKNKVDFIAFFKQQAEKRNTDIWLSAASHLSTYAGDLLPVIQITTEFCKNFKVYLEQEAISKLQEKKLSKGTAHVYFNAFKSCLNIAVANNIINKNPCNEVASPKNINAQREYLTIDEVRLLVKTDCQREVLKKAFLFSCLTGLRYSDINNLKWSEVVKTNNGHQLIFTQQKTKELLYLDISEQARVLLGETGKPHEKVFKGLYYSGEQNLRLQNWMIQAGINKKITFHSGRHTFAVLQLDSGSDIYTVSKLLGHANLKTTEIYSKILDKKKREAANRLPDIGIIQ